MVLFNLYQTKFRDRYRFLFVFFLIGDKLKSSGVYIYGYILGRAEYLALLLLLF